MATIHDIVLELERLHTVLIKLLLNSCEAAQSQSFFLCFTCCLTHKPV